MSAKGHKPTSCWSHAIDGPLNSRRIIRGAVLAADLQYLIAEPLKRGVRRSCGARKNVDGKAGHRNWRPEHHEIELLGKMACDPPGGEHDEIAVRHNYRRSEKMWDHSDDPPLEAELGQVLIRFP